jgi:hypothetical protein
VKSLWSRRTPTFFAARERVGELVSVNRSAISKLERRADMYVSTLQDLVKATGGELR